MELVTSIELPKLQGKLANIRLEVCASNNNFSHQDWHFEGISAVVRQKIDQQWHSHYNKIQIKKMSD